MGYLDLEFLEIFSSRLNERNTRGAIFSLPRITIVSSDSRNLLPRIFSAVKLYQWMEISCKEDEVNSLVLNPRIKRPLIFTAYQRNLTKICRKLAEFSNKRLLYDPESFYEIQFNVVPREGSVILSLFRKIILLDSLLDFRESSPLPIIDRREEKEKKRKEIVSIYPEICLNHRQCCLARKCKMVPRRSLCDHVNKVWKCSLYYVAETQFRVSGKNGNGQGRGRTKRRKEGTAALRIRTASGIFLIGTKERNTIFQAASPGNCNCTSDFGNRRNFRVRSVFLVSRFIIVGHGSSRWFLWQLPILELDFILRVITYDKRTHRLIRKLHIYIFIYSELYFVNALLQSH